jgi:hypothetical protein
MIMKQLKVTGILWAISAILPLILLAACAKTDAAPDAVPEGLKLLAPEVSVAPSVENPASRAIITGTSLPANSSIVGLYVCNHETVPSLFSPMAQGYNNMQAAKVTVNESYPRGWRYVLNGNATNLSQLFLRSDADVDIYAYYPYSSANNTKNPTELSFTSGSTNDYMWGTVTPSRINVPADYASATEIPMDITLHHAMTCIQIRIQVNYTGSIVVSSLTLSDRQGRIIANGTFSTIDGTITPGVTDDNLTCTFGTIINQTTSHNPTDPPNPGKYFDFYLMFPAIPEGIEPGDLTLTFNFKDGTTESGSMENIESSYTIPVDPLKYNNPTEKCGLRTGYKYVYSITISNYVKFTPIGVVPWEDTPEIIDYEI